jgi:hypothetical protein
LANNSPIAQPENGNIHVRWPQDYVVFGQQGQLCSSIDGTDEARKLAQLRCYADSFYETTRDLADAGQCVRKINTNWNAATAAEFLNQDGPVKAESQYIFEGFEYDSPNSASFRNTESFTEGIRVGTNWDDCEVVENLTFSMRKLPDSTDVIVEMISETRNLSTKPACVAYYADQDPEGKGVTVNKTMFLMKKQ